ILISGVVSLSLTPMLCSRFLKPPGEEKHGEFYQVSERFFERMLDGYRRSLHWVLEHRFATLMANVVIFGLTLLLFYHVPKGFIPDEDLSQVFAVTETAQGTSYPERCRLQGQIAAKLHHDPNIEAFFSGVGGAGSASIGGQNFGRMFFHLVPRDKR